MRNCWMRLWAFCLVIAGVGQLSWAESWIGAGGDDNWTTTGNWNAGDIPENPDTDDVTFSAADTGQTGIVTSNWQIGGIRAWQNTLTGAGATQTINLNSKTLTVTGNVNVADRSAGGSGPQSHELKFTGGTLQLGTPAVPVDVRIGNINTNNTSVGKVSFVSNVTLTPYIKDLKIGFDGGNTSSNGVFDLRNATIPGGVLTVNSLVVGDNARNVSALVTDNTLNILNTLTVKNDMVFGGTWGKARLGYATGVGDEHKLPTGFTINIGSASVPASSVKVGYNQYSGDGRLISTSGGSFNVYAADMRLADVVANVQIRTTTGIVDFSTMNSCMIDVGTLVVAKDYGYPGTVNMKAIGELKLPAGTLEADVVEVGAHKTGSSGLIELNGTDFKINNSLTMAATATIHIKVKNNASNGNNVLDLGTITPVMETGAKIKVTFLNAPPGTATYYGFAWQGDHVAELTSMTQGANPKLVIDSTAIAPLTASIFMVGNTTVIGIPAQTTPNGIAWDGGGANDNWSTAGNWVGDVLPANPEGNVLNFSAVDNNNTGIVTSNWQIGGIKSWQNTVLNNTGTTHTINLNSKTLKVTGDVYVADQHAGGLGLGPSKIRFDNGTLQLGTPAVPVDVKIGSINTNQYYLGKILFVSNVTLVPNIDELRIGYDPGSSSGGGGIFDLTDSTIPGGELKVNTLAIADGPRNVSALKMPNSLTGVNTLTIAKELIFGGAWGKARIGYATGGSFDEHKLPAGLTLNIGSASVPATSVTAGCTMIGGNARMFATSGGSFNVYAASMRLADVGANTTVNTSYGIIDVSTMNSCTVDVGTLIVAKDYGYPGTVNMTAIGSLKLPTGTFEADNVEVGAHKTGSSGLLEFNGTEAKINSSLKIEPTGIVRVNIVNPSESTDGLDLGAATLTINGAGKLELNFTQAPSGLVAYNALAMDGDHVTELQALVTAGKLVINDSALGSNYEAVIYTSNGKTYVGVHWPSNTWQEAGIGYFPSYNKALLKMREVLMTTPDGQQGLRATVYDTRNFTGNVLLTTTVSDTIDVDWYVHEEEEMWYGPPELQGATEFSIVFEGTLGPIPEGGPWVLYFDNQPDTTSMWLDDELFYDSSVDPNHKEKTLEAGHTYRVRITHANPTAKKALLSFLYWFKNQRSNMVNTNLTIRNAAQQVIYDDDYQWRPPATGFIELPIGPLSTGNYEATITSDDYENDVIKPIVRETFAWEGTTHGITSTIYAPFTALTYNTGTGLVKAVMREYTQTGLGLWSSVKACINDNMTATGYQELLNSPIILKVNGTTLTGSGSFDTTNSNAQNVIYNGSSSNGAITVGVHTETTIEGAMKVTMTLGTGSVNDMYLEIPLKDSMVPLYHVTRGSALIRGNPAGHTPPGSGQVWDSKMSTNHDNWPGNFKAYLWLGAEERGLAWFGESEKGWELDWGSTSNWPDWVQNGFQLFAPREYSTIASLGNQGDPCQTITRENGVVKLRIHFIQKPVTISTPRTIEFGLMASPGKPMPANWRSLGRSDSPRTMYRGGNVIFPLDGIFNAKYPRGKDWSPFAEFFNIRKTGNLLNGTPATVTNQTTWANNWATTHIAPYPAMETDLADDFTNSIKAGFTLAKTTLNSAGPNRLLTVYFDEFKGTSPWHDEMKTFNTEWSKNALIRGINQLDWADMPDGPLTVPHRMWQFGTGSFSESGQTFATWCGAQWLQNSVGLYFDNTFMEDCTNPLTTNCWVRADAGIQPATRLWARRDYLRRIWILHQQHKNVDWPQAMMCHITNTHVIPYHTWNQFNLDLEWLGTSVKQLQKKFTPALLRAESLGLQSGTVPVALSGLKFPELHRSHRGGYYVHEIIGPGFGDNIASEMFDQMEAFGYGLSDCQVYNYWGDEGAMITVTDTLVLPSDTATGEDNGQPYKSCKWLLLKRNGKLFILLVSWDPNPQNVTLDVDYTALGVTQPAYWVDAENTNTQFSVTNGNIVVPMPGYNDVPGYGVRMIQIP